MKVEQIYTGCLAQGAYYIESEGEVAIIDPLRETAPYIEKAERNGAKITYIFETHFHADFVSGHRELADKTGATIVYGPTAETGFDAHIARDGEIIRIGGVEIEVMHTPGHTMESTSYLLHDEKGEKHCVFTGDTLFIGDVGRPDLAIKSDLTKEDLAGLLFDSLRNKIMPLPDDIIVYPGHGAGSACGKNMSSETSDSLGRQKETNYALREGLSKEQFIKEVTDGIMPPPQYFPKNVMLNKMGAGDLDEIITNAKKMLSPDEFEAVATTDDVLILDTRHEVEFGKSHIPGSIFIGLDGSFASWVGTLIADLKQKILVIADEGKEEEVITRLSRVGYDYVIGFLNGGMQAWKESGKELDSLDSLTPEQFAKSIEANEIKAIVDVRKPGEYQSEHIVDATNAPLDYINEHMNVFKRDDEAVHVYCKGGYRSVIASSILKARGIHNIVNVLGGFDEISKTSAPKTNYVCPSQAE